ncbi:MAG: PKD domain-containing protein [Bacteroidota bacterium]
MKKIIISAFIALLSVVHTTEVKATHCAGIDMSYECLGGNDSFRVVVSFYRDCGGIAAPAAFTIDIRSASCGVSFSTVASLISVGEITPTCPTTFTTCVGGVFPGREEYVYVDTVTLPAQCTDWVFSTWEYARNVDPTTIVTPDNDTLYVEARLNNMIYPCNSSPTFVNKPAPFIYDGQTFCFNNGAVDLDGDSLYYSLIIPKQGASTDVVYIPPYSETQPLTSSPPVAFDPATGDICMTPTDPSEITVAAILVEEYRYGVFAGSVLRDIQINVVSGSDSLPYMDGINGTGSYTDTVCAGFPYSFTTNTYDADGGDFLTLTSNAATAIPGSNFISSGGARPTGTFTWTPTLSDVRSYPYCFAVTARDDACPVNGMQVKAFCLKVIELIADFTSSAPACELEEINFYSAWSVPGYTYQWNFGQDAVATYDMSISPNPSGVVYAASGAKTVILTITSPTGCIAIDTNIITINPLPSASFTSSAPKCAGDTVSFTNTGSSGAGVTYLWEFGLGANPSNSNVENPTEIVYSTGGTKTVIHFVTNQYDCILSDTLTITINETPVADFTSTAPSCTFDAVDFANTGTTGATFYDWDFGLDAIPASSGVENPTGIAYSTAGIKTVTLITTLGTCTDTSVQTINITETPAPDFTPVADACEGIAIDFYYSGTTGPDWTCAWDFGNGATPAVSTAKDSITVSYSGPGTKTVTLTVENGVCSETTTQTHTIWDTPVADFTSTAPSCTGDSVYFANTGTTGASYLWDFGTGASPAGSAVENPGMIVYDTSGSDIKTVTLVTTLGSCTDTSIKTINITETPAPSFTHTAPKCEGEVVDFYYTGTTSPNWTFDWDFGFGAIPATSTAEDSIGVMYSEPGTKTITLSVTGICSETTVNTAIIINPTPVADFTSNPSSSCAGDSIDFANTGTTGASYLWSFGTDAFPVSSTNEDPAAVVYSTDGIKTVTLITTLGSCVDTNVQTINITETPAPAFTHTAPQCDGAVVDFDYTGTTGPGWTYAWDFGFGATPSTSTAEDSISVIYSGAGTKIVTLTVANGMCSETLIDSTVIINQTPTADFSSTAPACTGDSVDFTNTGTTGGSWAYSWDFGSGATQTIPGSDALENPTDIIYYPFNAYGTKTITLIVTDGTCSDTSLQTINIYETPQVSFTSNEPQCAGEPVIFNNTGSSSTQWMYSWDFGAGAMPPSATSENPFGVVYNYGGNKTITLTINDGFCTNTESAIIYINYLPVAEAGPDTTICADEIVQIGTSAISGYIYDWFPQSTLNNPAVAQPFASPEAGYTTYIVNVTDTNNCQNTDSVLVTMLISAVVDAGPDAEICFGDTAQLGMGLLEGQTYQWTPVSWLSNAISPNPMAYPDFTILYTVSVTYEGCDTVTDDVLVIVHPLPDADAGEDVTIVNGTSVQLIATGGLQYVWTPETGLDNPGLFNPVASPTSTTEYEVTVTDIYGCVNTDIIIVGVVDPTEFIPTAFTPDGNGKNDVFYVRRGGMKEFELRIFDRWGELVFVSDDIEMGWDGTMQSTSEEMPEGAYVYSFMGVTNNDEEVQESGIVNLIR